MGETTFTTVSSAPRLEGGRPVFDSNAWLRLPRPGTRCPVSGLSRTTLAELVRPCPRNGYRPPVEARLLKRRDARRGVLLISRESLLGYLSELPPPESATSPASVARAAAAVAAQREAECAEIDRRTDLSDEAKALLKGYTEVVRVIVPADLTDAQKALLKAEILAGRMHAKDVVKAETTLL